MTAKWSKGSGGPAGDEAQNLVGVDLAQVTSGANRSNPQSGDPQPTLASTEQPAVAFALRTDPGGVGQGWNVNYVTATGELAHALTAEGADASEDGAGRGAPVVAFGHTNGGIDVRASEHVTPTLRAGHDVGGGSVSTGTAVRRLTPTECERLQGYPDAWTAKRAELVSDGNRWSATGAVVEQADAPRYRQLGNSIAVPVFEWVADGITGYEEDRA